MSEKIIRIGCLIVGGVLTLVLMISNASSKTKENGSSPQTAAQGMSVAVMLDNAENEYFRRSGIAPVVISTEAENTICEILEKQDLGLVGSVISNMDIKEVLSQEDYEKIMEILDEDVNGNKTE